MEATKKLNSKAVCKRLSNNAIIVMMLAITLVVGSIHPNFFSGKGQADPCFAGCAGGLAEGG